ncbi:DUF6090 family protein [Fulvivirga sedimenti]|uniref:Uncharacterized protein n=1 Tax=Fulvivirga sedimenti TaxID=2879465 RepID=A0A9X1HV18_9BACT|nr:DUF6090 family protein [Fulvivirga sedimenti]MCA6075017.1 hypothetical protein [Fulvivirga sedimenti]MCA6076194.1 hypothetical protein [Fulvivirga sedimenti]MCA6077322.1 hypothetical protein [Fulvivirga sedimenti]
MENKNEEPASPEGRPESKVGRYLKYATGEIVLVVIGILIALSINNWNQNRLKEKKEIQILKSFEIQFQDDIAQFDQSIKFYEAASRSIDIIFHHFQQNLPYSDSLSRHFYISTRFYGDSDLDNNVFESLKSLGVDFISNTDLRKRIVQLYEDDDEWIVNFEIVYRDFLFDASKNIFNTRFNNFWGGNYKDLTYSQGEMIPLDFESLKTDQEYLYFLRNQKNLLGWLIYKPIEETKLKMNGLLNDLSTEIDRLEKK